MPIGRDRRVSGDQGACVHRQAVGVAGSRTGKPHGRRVGLGDLPGAGDRPGGDRRGICGRDREIAAGERDRRPVDRRLHTPAIGCGADLVDGHGDARREGDRAAPLAREGAGHRDDAAFILGPDGEALGRHFPATSDHALRAPHDAVPRARAGPHERDA